MDRLTEPFEEKQLFTGRSRRALDTEESRIEQGGVESARADAVLWWGRPRGSARPADLVWIRGLDS